MGAYTRRAFLTVGSASAFAAIVGLSRADTTAPALVESGAPAALDSPAGALSLATFAPLVGTDFTMVRAGRPDVPLRLTDASANTTPSPGVDLDGEAFALLFDGPARGDDSGELAHLIHPSTGDQLLFVAPVGPDRNWEVVVDHRHPVGTSTNSKDLHHV